MNVRTLVDWEDLPHGTFIQDVVESGTHDYSGLWCFMGGSFHIVVPKKICKVIDEQNNSQK